MKPVINKISRKFINSMKCTKTETNEIYELPWNRWNPWKPWYPWNPRILSKPWNTRNNLGMTDSVTNFCLFGKLFSVYFAQNKILVLGLLLKVHSWFVAKIYWTPCRIGVVAGGRRTSVLLSLRDTYDFTFALAQLWLLGLDSGFGLTRRRQ